MVRSYKSVITLLVAVVLFAVIPQSVYSFGNWDLKVGVKGDDVYELQGRLTFLGYHHGKIDGHFGWQTYNSVRSFQSRFGLKVDGVAGSKTKYALWKATQQWRAGSGNTGGGAAKQQAPSAAVGRFSANDIQLMAAAVYGEARGEPYEGQVAVAAVILNRIKSSKFPNTIAGVIYEPLAFTAVADGQIYLTPNETSKRAVRDAINGWDPTNGCIYYFNPSTATSAWIWTRPQVKRIGKHIFAM